MLFTEPPQFLKLPWVQTAMIPKLPWFKMPIIPKPL